MTSERGVRSSVFHSLAHVMPISGWDPATLIGILLGFFYIGILQFAVVNIAANLLVFFSICSVCNVIIVNNGTFL